jgi:filamentous hemagglutinin
VVLFSAKNGIGQPYSTKAVLAGDTLTLNGFAIGTARGLMGMGTKGAAEMLRPMRDLVRFGQRRGAKIITLNGRYVTEEGARLGAGKVDDTFSFSFSTDEAGLRQLLQQLGR